MSDMCRTRIFMTVGSAEGRLASDQLRIDMEEMEEILAKARAARDAAVAKRDR